MDPRVFEEDLKKHEKNNPDLAALGLLTWKSKYMDIESLEQEWDQLAPHIHHMCQNDDLYMGRVVLFFLLSNPYFPSLFIQKVLKDWAPWDEQFLECGDFAVILNYTNTIRLLEWRFRQSYEIYLNYVQDQKKFLEMPCLFPKCYVNCNYHNHQIFCTKHQKIMDKLPPSTVNYWAIPQKKTLPYFQVLHPFVYWVNLHSTPYLCEMFQWCYDFSCVVTNPLDARELENWFQDIFRGFRNSIPYIVKQLCEIFPTIVSSYPSTHRWHLIVKRHFPGFFFLAIKNPNP